jgi:uncharacterized YigZ family protein
MERVTNETTWEGEKIKGSRFIVNIAPVYTIDEAISFLHLVKERYKDARHHCFAYRLSSGIFRSSDDGEPRGSAGRPILQRLESQDIVDSIIVVTRYFGGIKLGIGGLVRAYGGAAGKALAKTPYEVVLLTRNLSLYYDYADSGIIQSVVGKYNIVILETVYQQKVNMIIQVLDTDAEQIQIEIRDKSSGRIQLDYQ